MRSLLARGCTALVGLVAVLAVASLAAGESLTDQQIGRQIERRLLEEPFRNVSVSVRAHMVRLSGTVRSLWAKEEAIAKAGALSDVTSVVSEALEIERAENDRAIMEQIARDIGRVSIPAPAAAEGDRGLVLLPAVELPVSLKRITRQLDRLPPTHEARSVLRLSYYIQVYARSPRIDLVQGFDLHNGPVPYGAPTHAELLAVMSPREFRPAVATLNNIIGWTFKSLNPPR